MKFAGEVSGIAKPWIPSPRTGISIDICAPNRSAAKFRTVTNFPLLSGLNVRVNKIESFGARRTGYVTVLMVNSGGRFPGPDTIFTVSQPIFLTTITVSLGFAQVEKSMEVHIPV